MTAPTVSSSRLRAMPIDAVRELEQLGRERAVEAVDLGDAVADLDHGADAARLGGRVERRRSRT